MIGHRAGDYKMAGSMESSAGSPRHPQLPPGFRFHPTDEELIVHYLKKKASSLPLPVSIIAEVDIYKFDPWELPARATYGEHEWYFFTPRERKYPNGARPNRAATSGYWKATGTDKPVMSSTGSQKVGVKKALVFYGGKPPKGMKSNWIMHEYRVVENKQNKKQPLDLVNNINSLRLDDWVLCRIYKKNNTHGSALDQDKDDSNMFNPIPPSRPGLDRIVGMNQANKLPPSYDQLFDSSHPALYGGMIANIPLLLPDSKPQSFIFQSQLPSDHLLPMKRSLPSTQYYWDENGSSANDLVIGIERSTCEASSSATIASLLSQMPQTSSVFTSDPRGGLNWYAS